MSDHVEATGTALTGIQLAVLSNVHHDRAFWLGTSQIEADVAYHWLVDNGYVDAMHNILTPVGVIALREHEAWLRRAADKEAGCIISAGGWTVTNRPKPKTVHEYRQDLMFQGLEAEIARLQAWQDMLWKRLLDEFPAAEGMTWCLMANGKLSVVATHRDD